MLVQRGQVVVTKAWTGRGNGEAEESDSGEFSHFGRLRHVLQRVTIQPPGAALVTLFLEPQS